MWRSIQSESESESGAALSGFLSCVNMRADDATETTHGVEVDKDFHWVTISSNEGPSTSIASSRVTTSLAALFRASAAFECDCFFRKE